MLLIEKCPVPANTLLDIYSTMNGAYADCYRTDVPEKVSFTEFILAFYSTPLFQLERCVLELAVAKPSTDRQARQFAEGSIQTFAAWDLEGRNENEMLLCDFVGRTRSWLMTIPIHTTNGTQTQLYFGSAVVPKRNPRTGEFSLGFWYQALLGFHKIYSFLLLYSAKLQLQNHKRNSYEKQDQFHR
jgi:hypothetical protein